MGGRFRAFGASLKSAAQRESEGLDRDLKRQEWFCDEIASAAGEGFGARIKILQAGDKYHRCGAIGGGFVDFGAKFKPIHPRHPNVQKYDIVRSFNRQRERCLSILSKIRLVEGF